jgi:hypothetical protein
MTALSTAAKPAAHAPWYKQFWPWFLIVLPTTAVIASFITLYIAVKHADSPVQDDYVQHGLTVLHQSKVKTDTAQ